jgi:NAD(P)-dependent dehydrogenase (short-subunit alcohol dehydrogenase family)
MSARLSETRNTDRLICVDEPVTSKSPGAEGTARSISFQPDQEKAMAAVEGQRVLVVGGSRGLGLGVVEALVSHRAAVTVIARDPVRLEDLKARLGVSVIAGDASEPALAASAIRQVQPSALVLNAGATPAMAPLHRQTWESFSRNWDSDVKATFHWIQAAFQVPLNRGSRVLISSSGAAIEGSPLSGGYAGAKRMIWLMAGYANGLANQLEAGIRFQALLLRQIVGATKLGLTAAEAYARSKGVTTEAFLAGFGKPLGLREYGEHVVTLLTDPRYEHATALGIRGETGLEILQA